MNDELVKRLRGYSDEGVGAGGQLAHDLEQAADEIESAAQSDAHGVREGMMLDALQRAQRVMRGEVTDDQGKAWDMCVEILDEAITRAADSLPQEAQQNAEGRESLHRVAPDAGSTPAPASSAPDSVTVPREAVVAAARKLELIGQIYDGDKESRKLAALLTAAAKEPK